MDLLTIKIKRSYSKEHTALLSLLYSLESFQNSKLVAPVTYCPCFAHGLILNYGQRLKLNSCLSRVIALCMTVVK